MPEINFTRAGSSITRWVPEPPPESLAAYPWPKAIKSKLDASDAAWVAIDNAAMDHEAADGALAVDAPRADDEALRAAIRAGEPDPGTPATDAARRAEQVAWTRLEVAVEDARQPMQDALDAVAQYLAEHGGKVAAWEAARFEQLASLDQGVADAIAAADEHRASIGQVLIAARHYTGERFQPEPYMVRPWSERDPVAEDRTREHLLEYGNDKPDAGTVPLED